MPQDAREKTSQMPERSQGQDVTAGKGRRDEVGGSGIYPASGPFPEGDVDILTPADINESHGHREGGHNTGGVSQSDDLKGAERLPRKGNEMDKPDSDLAD